jgi:1,2-diacylglycerol 3-alpha-glucosyltransferase
MRIGMFTDTWYPTRDGVVTSMTTSRKILESMGHTVYVFAPDDPHGRAPREERVFYFPASEFTMYRGYRLAIYPARHMDDLIKDNGIDILHSHGVAFMGLKAMFSSRFTKVPLILTYHTMVTEAFHYLPWNLNDDLMRRLTWIYLKQFLARSDGVVAPTKVILEELKKAAPLRFTAVVPTGIDLERFNPRVDGSGLRQRLGLDGKKVLLHVGRVAREKNLEAVLDCMPGVLRKEPATVLVVAGDGPARPMYEALAKSKGLEASVKFVGFVPDAELPAYYSMADAFVIASKFETQGIVVMEALASGLPVAGINYRAIAEIVQDGANGYLFGGEPGMCAEAVLKALAAPDEVRRNALDTAKLYEQGACTRRLVEAYEKVLELSGRPTARSR